MLVNVGVLEVDLDVIVITLLVLELACAIVLVVTDCCADDVCMLELVGVVIEDGVTSVVSVVEVTRDVSELPIDITTVCVRLAEGISVTEDDKVDDALLIVLTELASEDVLETIVVGVDVTTEEREEEVIVVIVTVITVAWFAIAPGTPLQMLYPLLICRFAPGQFASTHRRLPSPIVNPELVFVVHKEGRSAVEEQDWLL